MAQDERLHGYGPDNGKELDGALAREAWVYAIIVLLVFVGLIFVLT
jgi:hypothetical protein